jgi:K+-sensing histidine kinase KdpD
MLTKLATKNTDAIGRQALQLAVQLPEDVTEARAVLDRTGEVLEGFLIRAPREIWNRPAKGLATISVGYGHDCALLTWTLLVLVLTAPLGAALAFVTVCEPASGLVLCLGLCVVSLVFGRVYGVIFALLSAVAHNYMVVEPLFAFSGPSRYELIRLVGFVIIAIGLPAVANAAPRLREVARIASPSRAAELQ